MSEWARIPRVVAALSVVGGCLVACSSSSPPAPWKLVWSDEFSGTTLDTTKNWRIDVGPGSAFGTQQVNSDTADPANVSVANDMLSLTAVYDGTNYTSGRIETGPFYAQEYGRFEASMKIPQGAGMWPGFWLLGSNDAAVGWPQCGEIDIMENRGADPTSILGSMHGPQGGGADYTLTAAYKLPGSASFSDDFHQFAIEWEPGVVRFYVDDNLYETQSSDLLPATQTWVFNHPFFVILDLAVGGDFGAVGASTTFPQSLQVQYVHIYARPGESPGVDAG